MNRTSSTAKRRYEPREQAIQVDFDKLTGRRIRIGVVDSGYSPGRKRARANICGWVNLVEGNGRAAIGGAECADSIGHGTAGIGIIARKAPDAEIYPVKIFADELVSDVERLCAAIRWCLENKLDVVNLSLGTTEQSAADELRVICGEAAAENMRIVAATSNDGLESFPASLPGVFGVGAARVRGKFSYYFAPGEQIQFLARGDRQRLDWKDDEQVFMGGTSFAAPHVAGILALLLERFPGISAAELDDVLLEQSLQSAPDLVDGSEFYDVSFLLRSRPNVRLADICGQKVPDIGRAVIYPFNKEMHSLVRFRHMLPFAIEGVVDVVGRKSIGKDSGEVIGAPQSGLVVGKNLEENLNGADTLVLGYLTEVSKIKRRDVLKETLELALRHEKHVYSLTPIFKETYPEICAAFEEKNLRLESPTVTSEDFEAISQTYDWRQPSQKPVVGVFGTSPQQGKFTTQLALRHELRSMGYKVGQLGTEHQSALFGFDYTFPNGYDGHLSIRIPMDWHVALLQSVMVGIECEDPHIVIVGAQSGVIPFSYEEKSHTYTLPALTLVMGTLPDACILQVNSVDEFGFIRETMNVLTALGKGEVILLVFSDKEKVSRSRFGRSYFVETPLASAEVEATSRRLEDEFQIPATEIVSRKGKKKMAETVESYFAEGD